MNVNIISLNTWGGRAGREGLLSFFRAHSKDTDIFCLQEIWSAPYEHLEGLNAGGLAIDHSGIMVYGLQEIGEALPEHVAFFRPHHLENYGLLMFVHKRLTVIEDGELFVYREKGHIPEGDVGNHARNIQFVIVETPKGPRTVINFHGLWNGKGKGDSDDRLLQSGKIIAFMKGLEMPYAMLGDFNLLPDTESMKLFETFGLRNLIKEYGVTSTRTSHYTKPEKFADYALVSDGLSVNDFRVLPDEVSDHAALFLDCE